MIQKYDEVGRQCAIVRWGWWIVEPAHPGDQVVEVIVITEILYHSPIELVFEAPVRHCQFELAFELIESLIRVDNLQIPQCQLMWGVEKCARSKGFRGIVKPVPVTGSHGTAQPYGLK